MHNILTKIKQVGYQFFTRVPTFFHSVTYIPNYITMPMDYVRTIISGIEYWVPIEIHNRAQMANLPLDEPPTVRGPSQQEPCCHAARPVSIDYCTPPAQSLEAVHINCPGEEPTDPEIEAPVSPTDFRVWEDVAVSAGGTDTFKFKVMSYNILAQALLESNKSYYASCDEAELTWSARSNKIYNEILSVDPDVICLQEVQGTHRRFFNRLEAKGYIGLYKQKTHNKIDGCALFYKKATLNYSNHQSLEYYDSMSSLLTSNNVGLLVKLYPLCSPKTLFVVATTHLVKTDEQASTRLAQMRVLLADIDKFAYVSRNKYYPVVITGDLNALPGSVLIKLLDTANIAIPIRDRLHNVGVTDNCQHFCVVRSRQLREAEAGAETPEHPISVYKVTLITHPFHLRSVYAAQEPGAPCFFGRSNLVDYIYYTPNNLRLIERLGLPTGYAESERIPNRIFASDHVSIAATFEMKIIQQ